MFVRVWEFRPRFNRLEAFGQAYGADGDWAALFAQAPGFLGTELRPSIAKPRHFLTLDVWQDEDSWHRFLESRRGEYDALDRRLGPLVETEREAGVLRRARPDDAPVMAALAGELGYPTAPAAMTARLAIVAARPDEIVLVAQPAPGTPTIAGWIHVFAAVRLESEPYGEVGGLIVSADVRGGGLGHALLAAGEAWARRQGCMDMRVRSNAVRQRAHTFYERCGYRSPKTQRVFVKGL
ncbi:MAG: GNAT family N-acetyltransferase [Vicinamibacterales bacterium]